MRRTLYSTLAIFESNTGRGHARAHGFTLIELLVTMVIVLIVITAAYQSYIQLLRGFVTESSIMESEMEAVVNTNLLRLDIAHAGYGLARDQSNRPILWNNSEKTLTIRSTIDNLKEETLGWVLCNNGTMIQNNNNLSSDSLDSYVFLDDKQEYKSDGASSCPSSGVFIGYPHYDGSDEPDGCVGQPCYNVTYTLSSTQSLEDCAAGTSNLQRTVSGGANWRPVLNCVADWQVAFKLKGEDNPRTDISSLSLDECYEDIEQIHVYLLVQEGRYDRNFTFSDDISKYYDVNLSIPSTSEASHYRWKMRKISVNPKDM